MSEFGGVADIWVNFLPKLVPWLITVRAGHSRHMAFKHFPVPWAVAIISGDGMCMTFLPSQAQARCHRIGQSKAVKVYRLITRNSYEREMFDKASLKLGLDKAVLQDINRKGSTNGVSMTGPAQSPPGHSPHSPGPSGVSLLTAVLRFTFTKLNPVAHLCWVIPHSRG